MNLFDQLVTEAIKTQPHLSSLRVVVEKELLHQDILRILSQHDLLKSLTFIGGTCLRACYGGTRLSEDLDFTGGKDFTRKSLSHLNKIVAADLMEKYGLLVSISDPIKESKNVDTWKIKIETKPKQKHLPAQRINIDICRIPSYDKRPMLLLNPYHIDMGTQGLIIQAQSLEEIYADKLLAFALRPNRLKYRDLWDIIWLHQQNITPSLHLIKQKLNDRQLSISTFTKHYHERKTELIHDKTHHLEFNKEMKRFLTPDQIKKIIEQPHFWSFITQLITDLEKKIQAHL